MSRARDLASNVTALDALADIQAMLTARGVGTVSEVGGAHNNMQPFLSVRLYVFAGV